MAEITASSANPSCAAASTWAWYSAGRASYDSYVDPAGGSSGTSAILTSLGAQVPGLLVLTKHTITVRTERTDSTVGTVTADLDMLSTVRDDLTILVNWND